MALHSFCFISQLQITMNIIVWGGCFLLLSPGFDFRVVRLLDWLLTIMACEPIQFSFIHS